MQDDEEWHDPQGRDGAGERVSLDQHSSFTLTSFRRSKFTRIMLWFVSILGFGSST